jgi:hypothetical protein
MTHLFREGDRVRTIRKTEGLLKSTYGMVVRVLVAPQCCDVQFDSYPRPRLVYHGDLELVERAIEVGQP